MREKKKLKTEKVNKTVHYVKADTDRVLIVHVFFVVVFIVVPIFVCAQSVALFSFMVVDKLSFLLLNMVF